MVYYDYATLSVVWLAANLCHLPCMPKSSVHVKCITRYTREVALVCECTRSVLSVLVKFVFMYTRTFLKENAHEQAKIASKT